MKLVGPLITLVIYSTLFYLLQIDLMWKTYVEATKNTKDLLNKQHVWFEKKLQSQGKVASKVF